MLSVPIRTTPASPTTSEAARLAKSVIPGAFTTGGLPSRTWASTAQPCSSPTAVAIRTTESHRCRRTAGSRVRIVPVSRAEPAITFSAVPALKLPTVSTAGSAGFTSRDTTVWSALTSEAPITTVSTA